jgi:tyrosyl-tRNA synthetase
VFREGGLPDEVPEVAVPADQLRDGAIALPSAIVAAGICTTTSEARRLIDGGGVKVDGASATDVRLALRAGRYLLQAGKRKAVRLNVPDA